MTRIHYSSDGLTDKSWQTLADYMTLRILKWGIHPGCNWDLIRTICDQDSHGSFEATKLNHFTSLVMASINKESS